MQNARHFKLQTLHSVAVVSLYSMPQCVRIVNLRTWTDRLVPDQMCQLPTYHRPCGFVHRRRGAGHLCDFVSIMTIRNYRFPLDRARPCPRRACWLRATPARPRSLTRRYRETERTSSAPVHVDRFAPFLLSARTPSVYDTLTRDAKSKDQQLYAMTLQRWRACGRACVRSIRDVYQFTFTFTYLL